MHCKMETCLLEPLDPCTDIDPLVSEPSVEQDDSNMLQVDAGLIKHLSSKDDKASWELEWEFDDGNIFNVIAQEL